MVNVFTDKIPNYVKSICETLNKAGFLGYVVGGALRDIALGLTPKDFDVATDASPDQIESLFEHTIPTGRRFGTITVVLDKKFTVEVTTFRKNAKYADKLSEDLAHRDFTINAIAYDPIKNIIYDPFNGLQDIKSKTLKTVGSAVERIREDPLRMMRAIRFKVDKGFTIITDTLSQAIKENAHLVNNVSKERIADELCKIIMAKDPTQGIYDLLQLNLLKYILPELQACVGVQQRSDHKYDLFGHLAHALKYAEEDLIVRLTVLLHDIGKTVTYSADESGTIHFYNHAEESAKIAFNILERLKFSNYIKNSVAQLIRHHMRKVRGSDRKLRYLMSSLGTREQAIRFAKVRFANRMGRGGNFTEEYTEYQNLLSRMEIIWKKKYPLKVSDLKINGKDVLECLGIEPGPIVGIILDEILKRVLHHPELNHHEKLIDLIPEIYEKVLKKIGDK
ncbi:hypothetical protein BBF96_00695 [Anoxybacter fermentans]|uniref:Polynucleotide adenylyltransferase n=1 Tax=Anoxybacter fermentans TaxID=1323375 RepID=A0A3Q9HQ10_9FIRM|nr:HD domain-containing protein [Anoxybacter fermentans]AZR72040.1 hypothetical protein BBF96_00695 [Anoxybacter fermentans]